MFTNCIYSLIFTINRIAVKTKLKVALAAALLGGLTLVGGVAEAQVKHVQYYDSLGLVTHDASLAKSVEVFERESEETEAGIITLYRIKGDSMIMLEQGSYATVFQPRKVHGQLVKWYPNGNRFSVKSFNEGVPHGVDMEWYSNDSLKHSIGYKQGQYDGALKTYYKTGVLKREELYQEGKQVYGKCYNEKGEEIPFTPYREMPLFPGGEQEMMKYLGKNIRYPAKSHRTGTSGVVLVRFVVHKDGSLDNFSIVQGVNEELNNEALRVIKKMPNFKPGTLEGQPVPMLYTLPIRFTLAKTRVVKLG